MPTTVELLKASAIGPIQADLEAAVSAYADAASASADLALVRSNAATNSANAAAASASTAVNAMALQFKGGIAGGSVPATLPLAGDYYEIISAGTSQSKTWAVGDKAIYNGSSGQWTQITGYFAPISSAITTLAAFAGGYPNSDGATSNRAAGIYGPFDAVNNPREWVAGAASLTIAAVVTVPTSNPSANGFVFSYTQSPSTAAQWGIPGALYAMMGSGGNLEIYTTAGASAALYRSFNFPSFRNTYSGQTIFFKATFTQGTANPVVEVNGGNISASFTASASTTPPAWLDASMVPTYRLVGYNWPAGPAPIVTPILGTTSAEDDAFYMATGKWPAWVVAGGSPAQLITSASRNSDFSAGVTDWVAVGSGSPSIAIVLDALQITSTALNGGAGVNSSFFTGGDLTQGAAYTWEFDVVAATGFWTLSIGGSNQVIAGGVDMAPLVGTKYRISAVVRGVSAATQPIRLVSAGASVLTIDNVKLTRIGALSLPSVQPINVIDDVSLLGGNQGRLLGCTPVTDKTNWRISANTWTSGNQQILAGSILDSTKHIIDLVEQSTTGTPTTTIGSNSAGSQYKASGALTAGINPTTLVTRKLASNDVWVNSNSTAVVRTTITGHIAT